VIPPVMMKLPAGRIAPRAAMACDDREGNWRLNDVDAENQTIVELLFGQADATHGENQCIRGRRRIGRTRHHSHNIQKYIGPTLCQSLAGIDADRHTDLAAIFVPIVRGDDDFFMVPPRAPYGDCECPTKSDARICRLSRGERVCTLVH
jgi:hypothetical protein